MASQSERPGEPGSSRKESLERLAQRTQEVAAMAQRYRDLRSDPHSDDDSFDDLLD